MKVQTKTMLVGLRQSKGQGDGESMAKTVTWDYTEFSLMIDLPTVGGKARGMESQRFRCGPSSDFEKFATVPLPCECEVDFDIVAGAVVNNKDTTRMELLAIKPSLQTAHKTAA